MRASPWRSRRNRWTKRWPGPSWRERACTRPSTTDCRKPSRPAKSLQSSFLTLLDFDNRASAQRIASLERNARDALLSLAPQTLKDLARRLNERELAALAAYQNHLDKPAAQRVLREVADEPGVMRTLGKPTIQSAILDSRDQLSAVTMLLRENSSLSFGNIGQDLSEVRSGDVDYRIFLERYWSALLIMALFGLLLLVLLKRLLFGRPPTVVIKHADGGRK